jgi:hypothetical protein
MSSDSWLCIGGSEIINSSRTAQMIAAGHGPEGVECRNCAPCPDLDTALGFPGGYSPGSSPWYDPSEPDSIEFAGLLVTSITGLEPGAFVRPVTEAAGVGAVIGQGRQSAPQIVVTGILMASTCCGAEYGLRWLRQALRRACAPGNGCGGEDLLFLSCEPKFPDEDCGPVDYAALLEPYYRTFKGAALIGGPTITQIIPRACPECHDCGLTEISFTLSAADPCMYHTAVVVADSVVFVCEDTSTECIEWVENLNGANNCPDDLCPPPDDCATDPNCQDVAPPSMPAILNPCVYDCISGTLCRACFDIPENIVPPTTEGALQLSIYSGDEELRRIQIQVWSNPLGLGIEDLEDCDICAQLDVSYVAPGSTLIIDGAGRTSTIVCPMGTTVRANPFISGQGGVTSFAYPTFVCGGAYTVCVTAAGPISPLATISASVCGREC